MLLIKLKLDHLNVLSVLKFWLKIQGRKAPFLELLETFSGMELGSFCSLSGLSGGIIE